MAWIAARRRFGQLASVLPVLFAGLACTGEVEAPADLVITNARIFTGTGVMVDRGSIVIRDGRLEAIGSSGPPPSALEVIDADGRTVLPGLMDVHRHLLGYLGPTNEAELRNFIETELEEVLEGLLASGLTTVMSPGDALPEILEIRERLENGDLVGPRLLTAGPLFTAPADHPAGGPICEEDPFCRSRFAVEVDNPEVARAKVREVIEQGVDFIKVVIDRSLVPDVIIDDAVFEAIASEAELLEVPVIVHLDNAEDMVKAVELGADKLVHAVDVRSLEEQEAEKLHRQLGLPPMATTVSWGAVGAAERIGIAPDQIRKAVIPEGRLDHIRYMLDHGALVAFGTDNPPPLGPTEFMVEVRELAAVMIPQEILEAMTINAARYLEIGDQLGSLEPGKIADLVIVDGDPLDDLSALENVVVVVQDGRVAFDRTHGDPKQQAYPGNPKSAAVSTTGVDSRGL